MLMGLPSLSLPHPGGSPRSLAQAKARQLVPGGAEVRLPGERVQGGAVLLRGGQGDLPGHGPHGELALQGAPPAPGAVQVCTQAWGRRLSLQSARTGGSGSHSPPRPGHPPSEGQLHSGQSALLQHPGHRAPSQRHLPLPHRAPQLCIRKYNVKTAVDVSLAFPGKVPDPQTVRDLGRHRGQSRPRRARPGRASRQHRLRTAPQENLCEETLREPPRPPHAEARCGEWSRCSPHILREEHSSCTTALPAPSTGAPLRL